MKRDWCWGNEQILNVDVIAAPHLWLQFRSVTPVMKCIFPLLVKPQSLALTETPPNTNSYKTIHKLKSD